jgi:hypothetical protein
MRNVAGVERGTDREFTYEKTRTSYRVKENMEVRHNCEEANCTEQAIPERCPNYDIRQESGSKTPAGEDETTEVLRLNQSLLTEVKNNE